MRYFRSLTRFIFSLTVALSLTACTSTLFKQTDNGIANTQQQIANAQASEPSQQPAVVENSGYYVNPKPVLISHEPAVFKNRVDMNVNGMPLKLLLDQLLQPAQMVVSFDNTVDANKLVSLNYHGSLKGALDRLADETNYAYTVNGQEVSWSIFETRTFDISFMPGASSYSVGGTFQDIKSENGESTGLGSGNEFSSLTGSLSVWQDLTTALDQLKSAKGQVMVSQATTTVTVRDYPENVASIAHYIERMNKVLSQEVELKVQVLQLNLDKQFQYGINWGLINQKLFHHLAFSLTGAAGAAADAAADAADGTDSSTKLTIGQGNRSALFQALSEQGKLSVNTQPSVITLNNQVASVKITKETGYLKSMTQSVDNGTTSTSLTPGNITDGFTLYLLPKIQSNTVYLQVSSTIANLDSISKVSSSPSTDESSSGSSTYNAIQVPVISAKQFNIRSRVQSGQTLVIAGFKSLRDNTTQSGPLGITALGGRSALSDNVETVILITPTVISK